MGFGYIFLGYVIAINPVYEGFTLLPAMLLILNGMLKLGAFNRPLKEARLWCYPSLVAALAYFAAETCRMFALLPEPTWKGLGNGAALAFDLLFMLFTLRLLSGIIELARETDLPRILVRAKRNLIFVCLLYPLSLFLSLPVEAEWFIAACRYIYPFLFIFRFVVMILNAVLIYSCYMYICLPEDLDMPRRETGIRFIDEWNRKNDEKETRNIALKKEELAKLYHGREQQYREKMEQKNRKNKKKK